MSRENVEAVRGWLEAYNQRDIEGLLGLSTSDIEFRSVFAAIESGGIFRGRSGVFEYFAVIDDAYETFVIVPHEFLDAGAAVLLVADAAWRGRESGAEGETPIWAAFWLRAGKIFREETFNVRQEALEAVGLREQ
jgi:ketosteroid isomerase-like protein